MKTVEHSYYSYLWRSIPFHPSTNLSLSLSIFTHRYGHLIDTVCPHSIEIFNAYQYRIHKLDFCSYNFHIFWVLQFGKGQVDVYCFMLNYSSLRPLCALLICSNPLSHLTTDASLCMKWSLYEIIHICTAVVDESEEWSLQ